MSDSATVLLAMDFQVGIVSRLPGAAALENACAAVAAARESGIPVYFVRVAFRPGYPEVAASNAAFSASAHAAGEAMTELHPATGIHPAFAVRADEPVVTKRRVSAFAGSDLDLLLRAAGARRLVLCGLSTSGVVLSTVRQAADLDFELTVLSDACADPDPVLHEVLTQRLFPKQASVVTTAEWIAGLVGAGAPSD